MKVLFAHSSHNELSCIQDSVLPLLITVAAWSRVQTVFARLNPTQGMDVCVCICSMWIKIQLYVLIIFCWQASSYSNESFWGSKRFPHQLRGAPVLNVSAASDVSIIINTFLCDRLITHRVKGILTRRLGIEVAGWRMYDRLCGLVVQSFWVQIPGSIPGTTRFSEK
jgi:hypothetical protein